MNVYIRLMGELRIEADGACPDSLLYRSRKGEKLLKYLIFQRGRAVSHQRLNRELESGRHSDNPESAMKTLVSRTRALLNEINPGLGGCIVSLAGSYKWESLPGVTVDVLEVFDILEKLRLGPAPEDREALTEKLMELYQGDVEDEYWLHREYLEAVYACAAILKEREAYNRILELCQRAQRIDDLDEQLHILRMEALANLGRTSEAMEEYRQAAKQNAKYYDAEPSSELQACYHALSEQEHSIKFNLDVIHNELTREDLNQRGPFFCDYRAFKEIYNIQIRNLERLGSTMFLAVIMLGSRSVASREGGMALLLEILRSNLRRGDIVTRFSENIVAMLLPTVNYTTGNAVMERIEKLFYGEYPSENISFHSRVSPIGGSHALSLEEVKN